MGKKIGFCGLAVLLLCIVIMSGCETTKGLAQGLAQGIAKDTKNTGGVILKVDDWIKKNLW